MNFVARLPIATPLSTPRPPLLLNAPSAVRHVACTADLTPETPSILRHLYPLKKDWGGKALSTDNAPAALGPYSQAIMCGSTLYVSGQLGLDPTTMEFAGSDVKSQAEQVMQNMKAVLENAGGSFASVVKTTVLLADMEDFAAVNDVYGRYFEGLTPPARACYAVKTLPKNALVEIEAIAEL